jgi:hypothetical protein
VLMANGHMISPCFMVEKQGSTKKRTVYNLKRMNREMRSKRIKLDDMRLLKSLARKGHYACSMDVGAQPTGKDGYHACQIHPTHQKYMTIDLGESAARASAGPADAAAVLAQVGVDIGGMTDTQVSQYWAAIPRFVMCSALPFGYNNAPWLFQKMMRAIATDLRRGDPAAGRPPIVCMVYLDDWLILAPTQDEIRRVQPLVDQVLSEYGLCRQAGKGVWPDGGTQIIEHLGVGANLGMGLFYVPAKRLARIRQQARSLLSSKAKHNGRVDSLWLAQFAGLAMSTWLAVKQARFRIRPMFDDLVRGGAYRRQFRGSVRLSRESVRMLQWWRDLESNPEVGRTLWRPPVDTPICTDASTSIGWGGNFGAHPLTGNPQQNVGLPAAGIWSAVERADIQAGRRNITGLELLAVRRCLERWQALGLLQGRSMLLFEDNAGVVGILSNFVAKSPAMRDDLLAIMNLLEVEDADLRVQWVASALNPSDYFSRMPNKGEWRLRRADAALLLDVYGPCTVDRFADSLSAQLPRFNSPYLATVRRPSTHSRFPGARSGLGSIPRGACCRRSFRDCGPKLPRRPLFSSRSGRRSRGGRP